ncbi:MAG: hypothetical protein ACKVRN_13075 [Pyrinomonadaceae bacterium]
MNNENKQKSKLWVALPTAIIVGVAVIFLFFVFMVVYGHVINPGHEESHYQEVANLYGPYANIIGGIPVMFAAGRLLRWFFGDRALKIGIAACVIYSTLYLIVLIAGGIFTAYLPHILVSFATKLPAVYLGARTPEQAS